MSNLLSLTSSQLNKAAKLKDQITALEKKLADILGGAETTVKARLGRPPKAAGVAKAAGKKKRTMSAAGRAKIAAAAKARWAKAKAAGKNTL